MSFPVPEKLHSVVAEAWEGGGMLGHAYGPIIEALEGWGLPIIHHAGTSAGAITAMLRALAVPAATIRRLQEETPWRRFAQYRPPALARLVFCGGWHSIDYARAWICDQVEAAGMPNSITFEALRRRTGHSLYVGATRYLRHGSSRGPAAEPYVFSPDRTPDTAVAEAVLASMAVPLFWPPVRVAGWWYCDGGVAMNHPLAVFSGRPCESILGVRLDSHREIEVGDVAPEPFRPGLGQIILANGEMLRAVANQTFVPESLWSRIVRVDVGAESALDFRSDSARIDRLRAAGLKALRDFAGETA